MSLFKGSRLVLKEQRPCALIVTMETTCLMTTQLRHMLLWACSVCNVGRHYGEMRKMLATVAKPSGVGWVMTYDDVCRLPAPEPWSMLSPQDPHLLMNFLDFLEKDP